MLWQINQSERCISLTRNKWFWNNVARQVEGFCISYFAALKSRIWFWNTFSLSKCIGYAESRKSRKETEWTLDRGIFHEATKKIHVEPQTDPKHQGGGHIKAVFWLGIMVLMQISRSRFTRTVKNLSAHLTYLCFELFCKYFGDFWVYLEIKRFSQISPIFHWMRFYGDFHYSKGPHKLHFSVNMYHVTFFDQWREMKFKVKYKSEITRPLLKKTGQKNRAVDSMVAYNEREIMSAI